MGRGGCGSSPSIRIRGFDHVEFGKRGIVGDASEHAGLAVEFGATLGKFGGGAREIKAEFGCLLFLEEGAGKGDGFGFELETLGLKFSPDRALGETCAGCGQVERKQSLGGGFYANAADGLNVGREGGEDEFGGLGIARRIERGDQQRCGEREE